MTFYGDKNNLPTRLSNYANKENIIYWSIPRDDQPMFEALFWESTGPLALPCCWPILLVTFPCNYFFFARIVSRHLESVAVLTTSTLEMIESNGTVGSIPLENIKSVTATTKGGNPFATICTPEVSRISIDDGSVYHTKHGQRPLLHTVWCHDNIDEFRRLIFEAKERRLQMTNVLAAQMMMPMQQTGQQQPMMMMQQPTIQQPVMQQPYSYTPPFTSSTQVYPQSMNSNPVEYPKR